MGTNIENQEIQSTQEFPNLEYIILDVRKKMAKDKVTLENPKYAELLNVTIRLILLKEKFGILKPGQPSEEKKEWFDIIKEKMSELKTENEENWEITSARRHQRQEEKRAGQTYQESGLE